MIFTSKWLDCVNTPTQRTDKTDKNQKGISVSNVSSFPGTFSQKNGSEEQERILINELFEFLVHRIELVPLGFCSNECTYWANEAAMFAYFKQWIARRGLRSPSLGRFKGAMKTLFPEPHVVKFYPKRGEWWGFRFNAVQRGDGQLPIIRMQ